MEWPLNLRNKVLPIELENAIFNTDINDTFLIHRIEYWYPNYKALMYISKFNARRKSLYQILILEFVVVLMITFMSKVLPDFSNAGVTSAEQILSWYTNLILLICTVPVWYCKFLSPKTTLWFCFLLFN